MDPSGFEPKSCLCKGIRLQVWEPGTPMGFAFVFFRMVSDDIQTVETSTGFLNQSNCFFCLFVCNVDIFFRIWRHHTIVGVVRFMLSSWLFQTYKFWASPNWSTKVQSWNVFFFRFFSGQISWIHKFPESWWIPSTWRITIRSFYHRGRSLGAGIVEGGCHGGGWQCP